MVRSIPVASPRRPIIVCPVYPPVLELKKKYEDKNIEYLEAKKTLKTAEEKVKEKEAVLKLKEIERNLAERDLQDCNIANF